MVLYITLFEKLETMNRKIISILLILFVLFILYNTLIPFQQHAGNLAWGVVSLDIFSIICNPGSSISQTTLSGATVDNSALGCFCFASRVSDLSFQRFHYRI